MVLRASTTARRAFREAGGDRLVDEKGTELQRQAQADPVDGLFRVIGMYRDTNNGGLFTECLTGRTFELAPNAVEAELQKTWTDVTPSKQAQIFVDIEARLIKGEVAAERLLAFKRDGTCPAPPPRSAALRDTEWRLVEIDNEKPTYEDWRQRPRLRLDEQGSYSGSAGCNALVGSYQLDAEGLRFLPGAATLMACPPAVAAAEQRFLSALADVRQAQVSGVTLDLLDGAGKRRLRFEARGR
jgi:copper homeostasis protein (lipoprotein)